MDETRIKEIFSDEEFVKSLFALETPQEVQAAIGAKGIELSIAEIETIRERLVNGNGELSAEELDGVAGGCVITTVVVIAAVAAGVLGVGGYLCSAALVVQAFAQNRW